MARHHRHHPGTLRTLDAFELDAAAGAGPREAISAGLQAFSVGVYLLGVSPSPGPRIPEIRTPTPICTERRGANGVR
jgi:hypothetical protein